VHGTSSLGLKKAPKEDNEELMSPGGLQDEAVIFICDTFMDFLAWRKALESYVV